MRKAFTLLELVVSLGILAMILSFSGIIFRVSTDSQRIAMANAEIMQKLRVITEQLDTDFCGLCKDGEILVFWRAWRKPGFTPRDPNDLNSPLAFERHDTIMFFATGEFSTLRTVDSSGHSIHGNIARICYTLANVPSTNPADPNPVRPLAQKASNRMLARTQHILVPPAIPGDPTDPLGMSGWKTDPGKWRDWNSKGETDAISMQGWLLLPNAIKADIISVICDVSVGSATGLGGSTLNDLAGGTLLNPAEPNSMYTLLCDGVGQFEVQGWSIDPNDPTRRKGRWMPEIDPNGNGKLSDDSDFILDPDRPEELHTVSIPGMRYPDGPVVLRNNEIMGSLRGRPFNEVPGLGRALKFTFTLYDSRGLIPNGRTFTHIVYLDN
jgi:prepilin-type N-terminal cleavage/methylation domain-containing protein